MLNGKINLTSFHNSSVQEIDGKKCVVIPIEDNHLFEDRWGRIWVTLISFASAKLKPYTHWINISVKKEFRDKDWRVGAWRLEE